MCQKLSKRRGILPCFRLIKWKSFLSLLIETAKTKPVKKLLFFLILSFNLSFAQTPTFTSFSPASGAIGSSVSITGTGFNNLANQNVVFFGATQATVTAANDTNLTVTVPLGATYQYISVTNLAVNLTTYFPGVEKVWNLFS